MIPAASVTIDRASLSLADLVISNAPSASAFRLESFGKPGFTFRKRYAPESEHVAGQRLLTAVLDADTLPFTVNVRAASTAALAVLEAELEAALAQFSYDLTLTVDGVSVIYEAECTWPQWVTDSGMVQSFVAKTSVVVPVNPPGA